jgi:hypothetical protein
MAITSNFSSLNELFERFLIILLPAHSSQSMPTERELGHGIVGIWEDAEDFEEVRKASVGVKEEGREKCGEANEEAIELPQWTR